MAHSLITVPDTWPQPTGGWPPWVLNAPYHAAAHPQQSSHRPVSEGANCQRYAYGVLALFDLRIPNHRSSELWDDARLTHPPVDAAHDLDLVLFSAGGSAWGAHVAVVLDGRLLHLSAEVGRPVVWDWEDFTRRDRYKTIVGVVRAEATGHGIKADR